MSSCSVDRTTKLETPFVTVVKLIDAEQALHLEDARQYIDVIQVYTKLGSENPEEDWEKLMKFNNNLGKDKKFTNAFGYRDYDIEETVNGNNASVCFKAKDDNASIKKIITYGLEKRQKKWVVVSINYVK
ncbi:MAG: hypothetical protein H6544_07885 [Prevotellaceae bacterium]|nr:hypothetical protein [Prevotellaceae bacterium]